MVEFVYNCLYLKELRSEEVYKKIMLEALILTCMSSGDSTKFIDIIEKAIDRIHLGALQTHTHARVWFFIHFILQNFEKNFVIVKKNW